MAKLNLYMLLDKKVREYTERFFARTDDEAERIVGSSVQDMANLIAQYPSDYALYRAGTVDTETGEIVPEAVNPVLIAEATAFVQEPPQNDFFPANGQKPVRPQAE